MGNAKCEKCKEPDVWLTEQGVLFAKYEPKVEKNVIRPAWRKGPAEEIMDAYVKHGSSQVTQQIVAKHHQVVRFFYYNARGIPKFDTGLLEAPETAYGFNATKKEYVKVRRKKATSTPREIYGIYKHKTTGL
jgi:hypothetical protein